MHPFENMTLTELVAIIALVVSVLSSLQTQRRDSSAEHDRQAARAAEQQVVTDKLDTISDMSRETRDTVREMSKQLADHASELAKIETRIGEHERRLDRLDERVGGTD